MKIKTILLSALCVSSLFSYSQENRIELPLTIQSGYGPFHASFGGISPYIEGASSDWEKTYLKAKGGPATWTEVKYGDIETNIYQTVYQNYLNGNIPKERYEYLQKTWNWIPDTVNLSREPIKCKIAFAYGKDAEGKINMVVDSNNNFDFSDDKTFIPINNHPDTTINEDSLALANSIKVSFERFVNGKKVLTSAPFFITFMSELNMYMCNFPQYATAKFNGVEIAVCSSNFTDLSYKYPSAVLIKQGQTANVKANTDDVVAANEYIDIENKVYKFIGINQTTNKLILEKMDLSKDQLTSSQVGYRAFDFEGSDFKTKSVISSHNLKGKYVLIDFWAVWCGPCKQEIPNLKELYSKIDKSKVEIVGIVGDSSPDLLMKMIDEKSINWPQIVSDDKNKIKEAFGIHGYPTTILINPEGVIIAKNLRGKDLEDKVMSLTQK